MSKLLKAIVKRHRPHIAARMTPANEYDEKKHTHAKHLKDAGIINKAELADLDGCIDDLGNDGSAAANFLKATENGKGDSKRLNDADFVKALMAADPMATDGDDDTDDEDGDDADDGEGENAGEKITA